MSDEREFKNLPEGWKWVRLGEVVEKIKNGYVYNFSQIKKEGIPITRIESISEGYIDENKVGYLDLTHNELVKDFKLEIGDILFSHINSFEHVGKTSIYKGKPSFLIHGMNLLLLRAKKSICSPFFLIFLLKSEEIRGKIRNLSGQAVNQVSVNTSDLYNLKLPLPPLPEQQKIAEILKTIDNAIEKTDKIIEKYKRIKQGLMQDLLTKGIDENGNIRDEKTHKFKDSPLGRIPEEWEVIRLGEVGEVVNGFSFPIKYQGREFGNLPFIKVNDLNKSPKYIISSDNYIDQITTEFLKVKIFPPDTIVFPKIGMAVYQNKYRILKTFATFDNNIAGVLPKNYSSNFLFYYFSVKLDLKGLAGETAVPSIKKSILEAILLPLPLLPEQQRIAEILSQTDQTIEKEQQYKEKLQRIKQGLMEDLLTGKLRVNKLIKED